MITNDTSDLGLKIRESLDLEIHLQDYESRIQHDTEMTLRGWIDHLSLEEDLSKRMIEESLYLDLEIRLKRGERFDFDNYIKSFPEIDPQSECCFELAELYHRLNQTHGETSFGHFRVFERVGEGAFGTVHRACDARLSRIVALKGLKDPMDAQPDDSLVKRYFMREGRYAGKLHHPNIATVYEVGQFDQQTYIAYRFVQGGTLSEQISKGAFEPLMAATITSQLADALVHAHGHGLVHRDIKPSNILMETPSRPVLTDFGLAKDLHSNSIRNPSSGVVGTLAYMAPEQLGSKNLADHRVDIYALGCLLYEMITSIPPFRGTAAAVVVKILNQEPLAPRKLDRTIPKDIETICLKALSKNPNDRYENAAKLRDDLEAFIEGRPIGARRPGCIRCLAQAIHRSPVTASLILGLLAVVSITIGGLWNNHQLDLRRQIRMQQLFEHSEMTLQQITSLDITNTERLDEATSVELRRTRLSLIGQHYQRWLENDAEPMQSIVALYHLGDIERLLGDWDSAIVHLRQAAEVSRQIANRQKPNDQVLSLHRSALRLLRDSPEGFLSLSERCDIAQESYRLGTTGQKDFSQVHDTVSLAGLLMRNQSRSQADKYYRIAHEQLDSLHSNANWDYERLFALGKTSMRLGDRKRALRLLMQLVASPDQLLPKDFSSRQLDAESSHYIACLLRTENQTLALDYALRAQQVWTRFLKDRPVDNLGEVMFKEFDLHVQLGHNSNLLGGLYGDLHAESKAIDAFENAVLHYRAIKESNAREIPRSIKRGLGNALHSLGRIHQESEKTQLAADFFRQALAVRNELIFTMVDPPDQDLEDVKNTEERLRMTILFAEISTTKPQ
ncbi:MAG: protein kinase domain-containing protein [Planctomycetota bacterium]|jgi:serine/threonine protein kinase/tetratricopeptide (TPR) repeat protein